MFIPCTWCCFTWGVVSEMWAAVFSTAKKTKKQILHLNDKKWKERNIFQLDSVLKHHAPPDVTICMVQNFNLKSKSKEFIIDPRFLPVNGWSAGITHNTGFSFFLIALCVGSSSTTSLPCNAYNKLHLRYLHRQILHMFASFLVVVLWIISLCHYIDSILQFLRN